MGVNLEFIDDEENIVLELLGQLEGFTALVGGQEQEKALVPLLIAFCRTDEKKCALKASAATSGVSLSTTPLRKPAIAQANKAAATYQRHPDPGRPNCCTRATPAVTSFIIPCAADQSSAWQVSECVAIDGHHGLKRQSK